MQLMTKILRIEKTNQKEHTQLVRGGKDISIIYKVPDILG